MPVVGDIHNEKQLGDFIAKRGSIEWPINTFQWRCFVVPDYSATESVFIFKVHHVAADGISLMCMINDITDDPKVENYPNMRLLTPF